MNKLLIIILFFIFCACQKESADAPILDNNLFGIEKITINGKDFTLKDNSFLINTEIDNSLVLIGSTSTTTRQELNYAWLSVTEKLSSASMTCKKAQVSIKKEKGQSVQTFILTAYTTNPQAEMPTLFQVL